MCLNYLIDYTDLKTYKDGVGWKVFTIHELLEDTYIFQHQILNGTRIVPRGKWIIAQLMNIEYVPGKFYQSGFHIYLQKPKYVHAPYEDCVEVKFRNPICTGADGGIPTVVAKEMLVQ